MGDKTKLAELQEELEEIHFADNLYSKRRDHSSEATSQYQWRQERLKQVRKEMKELKERI